MCTFSRVGKRTPWGLYNFICFGWRKTHERRYTVYNLFLQRNAWGKCKQSYLHQNKEWTCRIVVAISKIFILLANIDSLPNYFFRDYPIWIHWRRLLSKKQNVTPATLLFQNLWNWRFTYPRVNQWTTTHDERHNPQWCENILERLKPVMTGGVWNTARRSIGSNMISRKK